MSPGPVVRIDRMATGGEGVGRLPDGRVVFVPRTAPGDRVELGGLRPAGRLARAEVARIVEPSGDRRDPPCSRYGSCGGCALQHLTPGAQLRAKQGMVSDHLVRSGLVPAERVAPIRPSPSDLRYRVRMRFHVRDGAVGLFRRGSHELVALDDCPIATEAIGRRLEAVAERIPVEAPGAWDLELVDVGGDGGESVEAALHGRASDARALRATGEALLGPGGVLAVVVRAGAVTRLGPAPRPQRAGLPAGPPAGVFRQANPGGNEILRACVRDELGGGATGVLELFAGSGNFSFALAAAGRRVLAVESDREAVAAGADRARAEGAPVEFHRSSAEAFLRADPTRRAPGERRTTALLNPPRAGLGRTIPAALDRWGLERLVYVSCDPATLGRDLRRLARRGWRVRTVTPVDLFPQTAHVECVVRLERT